MRYLLVILFCCIFTPALLAQDSLRAEELLVKKERIFDFEKDFTNVSSTFTPKLFERIRTFVLENGEPHTFRNLDNGNPWYAFSSLDVFLGPSRKKSFLLRNFRFEDYYEMTIRDNEGKHYQFVCFDEKVPEQTFIHQDMLPGNVYWWNYGDKYQSSDLSPLLQQIEDEIVQNAAANEKIHFVDFPLVLKQEFHPMERIYTDVENTDTLSFDGSDLFINGEQAGTFDINKEKRILSLKINKGKQPVFAIFPIEDVYHYRYMLNKEQRKLFLVPLDETEGDDLICVEGCTLQFELLDK